MKKFTFSFKSLLVAAGLLLGSANAWADVVETYPFATWVKAAGGDQKDFTFSGASATVNSSDCYTYTSALNGNSLGGRFAVSNTHKNSGLLDQVWFRLRNNSETDAYTGLFVGDSKSTYLAILNLVQGDKVTITFNNNPEGNKFYSSNATYDNSGTPTAIVSGTTKPESDKEYTMTSDGHLGLYMTAYSCIKTVSITRNITPYTTRMATAKSKATSLSSSVMRTSVKSALTSALSSEYVDMASSSITSSNIDAYITALETLETAVTNAQASADNFAILNNLINNSKPAGYVDPSGAATVYTSDADVDPVALASSVRAAVVAAGTVSNNTDISALIANKSFELGSSIGWTIAPSSDDSGINVTGDLLTIFPNGNTVSQNVGTLPAGRYKLSAKAWSNGATVYLIANENHSEGTVINGDELNVEYTFTLTAEDEVTIGINSGDQYNGNAFVADGGRWWYRCDNFSLIYVDDDPLGRAQKALNDEIDAATDVKNAWTPRVGTTPFKYNSTYYDALVTELSEANAVKVGGSDDPDDYTTAKTELETAKTAIASSVLNEPASDKYYRLYLAEGGVSTGKNLNMLKYGAGNTVITEAPYPVKFVKSGENYIIENAYDYYFVTPKSSNSSWGTYTGLVEGETMEVNANVWSIVPQEDGTFKMLSEQTSWKSWSWYVGTFSTDEGSKVAPYDSSRSKGDRDATKTTWLCSGPVDVTETPLFVSAAAKTGTFISAYDNLTPATVKAYTVAYKSGNALHLEENESGVLNANTPYILTTEEVSNVVSTFTGIKVGSYATRTENGLVGLLTAGTVPSGSYVLQNQSGVTSFYQTSADLAGTANRCYLDLTSVPDEPTLVKGLTINLVGDITTGVDAPVAAEATEDGVYYNLNGQQVTKDYKGIVIVNGKKFYNK